MRLPRKLEKLAVSGEKQPGADDISEILRRWRYEATRNARIVEGVDGKKRIQVRLPLGIEQYEIEGRPDGLEPFGHESLLHYFLDKLEKAKRKFGTDEGFRLGPEQCARLREEGMLYYYRYVLFFQLGDFARTIRDAERNLKLFDFVAKYAQQEQDRLSLEQYRPYLVRMRNAAMALLSARRGAYDEALNCVKRGIEEIEAMPDIPADVYRLEKQRSLSILRGMAGEIKRRKPMSREEKLEKRLQEAVQAENYERAAKIRDVLKRLREEEL